MKGRNMNNYLEWSQEYRTEANRILSVIEKIKEKEKFGFFTNKKDYYNRVATYKGYYNECINIANLLEARHKGVM